jgi:hypothetical protein
MAISIFPRFSNIYYFHFIHKNHFHHIKGIHLIILYFFDFSSYVLSHRISLIFYFTLSAVFTFYSHSCSCFHLSCAFPITLFFVFCIFISNSLETTLNLILKLMLHAFTLYLSLRICTVYLELLICCNLICFMFFFGILFKLYLNCE